MVTAAAPVICACGSNVFAMDGTPPEPFGTIEIKSFLATYSALKTVNGSIVYRPPSPNQYKPIVISCTGVSPYSFSVLTAICTHQGVTVNPYNKTSRYIYCSGHGSHFDINGAVLVGPATRPLTAYQHSYDEAGDILSVTASTLTSDVAEPMTTGLELYPNSPNPFTDKTSIRFFLPSNGHVRLNLSDVLGSEIATLFEGALAAGEHMIEYNGDALTAGVYFYRLTTVNGTLVKQMVKK